MSEHHEDKRQVHYVGDSRVKKDRKKTKPADYYDFPGKTEAFFPDFLLKEWMVAAVFLVGFMTLVMADLPPLGEVADPTNTSFLPVPDWYFLFMYQLLKYKWASGDFMVIGTVVLPGVAFTALALAPWLDVSKERSPLKRPLTTSIMIVSLVSVIALTWVAEYEHKQQLESSVGQEPKNRVVMFKDEQGYEIYQKNACITCHGRNLEGVNGPSLLGIGDRVKGEHKVAKEDIIKYMDYGKGLMPAGMFQGNDKEKEVLASWLMKQKQK